MACSAQITHTMHPLWSRSALTVWRAVKPCCHAMQACRCVDNTRETPPRLRACANYHTHLPVIKRPPRQQLLGYQVGDADDETTLQRGALDVAAKFMKLTFRRGVLVRRQQRRQPSPPANTLHRLRTRLAGFTELPPGLQAPQKLTLCSSSKVVKLKIYHILQTCRTICARPVPHTRDECIYTTHVCSNLMNMRSAGVISTISQRDYRHIFSCSTCRRRSCGRHISLPTVQLLHE